MARVESNIGEIRGLFDDLARLVDFTDDGLGRDCLAIVAGGIVDRNRSEVGPDGSPWPENRGDYGRAKRNRGLPVGVGLRGDRPGGDMISLRQVQGEVVVTPDEATMRYGTDDAARDKASWFTRGSSGPGPGRASGAKNQPPRPFFEMSEEDEREVMERIEQHVEALLRGE